MSKEVIQRKVKVHTAYRMADGTRVPSVSTILGELAKPALIHWAWNLGIQGIDYKKFTDNLAEIGRLAHTMILENLGGEPCDRADYSPEQISLAENCFLSYLAWEKLHKIEPIALETPLVSELHRYGGTSDFYGLVDGMPTLMDFKTGKAIYPEHFIQLAGYAPLLIENKMAKKPIQSFRVLNIPRAESEAFDEKVKTSLNSEWKIFQAALSIYYAKLETF